MATIVNDANGRRRLKFKAPDGRRRSIQLGKVTQKAAARVGVELWERPWVNMRASAATDAADKFPGHVCESSCGHSEAIAKRHYRQVTEEHFQEAVSAESGPQQRVMSATVPTLPGGSHVDRTDPFRNGAESGRRGSEKGGAKSGARKDEKVAQKPSHHPFLLDSTESRETQKALGDKVLERFFRTQYSTIRLHKHPQWELVARELGGKVLSPHRRQVPHDGFLAARRSSDAPFGGARALVGRLALLLPLVAAVFDEHTQPGEWTDKRKRAMNWHRTISLEMSHDSRGNRASTETTSTTNTA